MLKPGEEDVTAQKQRVAETRENLAQALSNVEKEAKSLKKRFSNNRDDDLDNLYSLINAVRRAEEDYDLARYDLGTASGEDG